MLYITYFSSCYHPKNVGPSQSLSLPSLCAEQRENQAEKGWCLDPLHMTQSCKDRIWAWVDLQLPRQVGPQFRPEGSGRKARYAREPALGPPDQVGVAYESPIDIHTDCPWGHHVPSSPNCVALGDSHSILTVEMYRVTSLC